jgi:hypothetical protein
MTAPIARIFSSLAVVAVTAACGGSYYEIPLETPIRPKLDTSGFERILVAGFIAGGTEDVDGNVETTRLLRSQLRSQSDMRVIDSDVLPLVEVANETRVASDSTAEGEDQSMPAAILEDEDLVPYEHLFADAEYWKQIGEEYQQPLIVTGTVMFAPQERSGIIQNDREVYDSFGRRSVVPVRTYMERTGFVLKPRFVFIDGRTGAVLYSENFREEVLYNANQASPALSAYFELMDRLLPSFLSTLSTQTIKGTRVLLQ